MAQIQDPWEEVLYIAGSRCRRAVLEALNRPRTPGQLVADTGLSFPHTSRALSELVRVGLAEVATPEQRRGKVYRRTERGDQLIQAIKRR